MRFLILLAIFCAAPETGCSAGGAAHQPAGILQSIQARIDQATDGDTILVEPGTYYERINYWGRAVVVKSIAGPDSTVIDGERKGSVVTFTGCADTFSVLDGFTVRRGFGTLYQRQRFGGGIYAELTYVDSSSCKLLNCIIEDNIAAETQEPGWGGGISFWSGIFVMRGCTLKNNSAPSGGGGANIILCSGHIYNNRIIGNRSTGARDGEDYFGGHAGGMELGSCGNLLIEKNVFIRNTVSRPSEEYSDPIAGSLFCNSSAITIRNNRFEGNGGGVMGGAMYIGSDSEGTIVAHNLFVENSAGDYWDSGSGGAVYCKSIGPYIINNTCLRNGAYQGLNGSPYGGTIAHQRTTSIGGVFNNIIAENLSGRYAAALYRPPNDNNCYWDNVDGDVDDPEPNAVFADPMFKSGQYRIHPGSPCIDAGVIKLEDDPYCLELPDIGAYESCTDFIIPFWADDSIRHYPRNRKN